MHDGQVFLLDREEDERDVLRCLDMVSGKELWRSAAQAPGRLGFNGSRGVPSVDDDTICAIGPFGHVYGYDRKLQKNIWTIDIVKRFSVKPHDWGIGQSPLFYRDHVIVAPMSEEVGLLAVDQRTGKTIWTSDDTGEIAYASPAVATICGFQGILFNTNDRLSFVDPDTGKILWSYTDYSCRMQIPPPTVLDEDWILISRGYK